MISWPTFLDSTGGAEEVGAAEASLAGGVLFLLPLGWPLLGGCPAYCGAGGVGCGVGYVAGGGWNAGSAGNSSNGDSNGGGEGGGGGRHTSWGECLMNRLWLLYRMATLILNLGV